jgi:hypothetical protein
MEKRVNGSETETSRELEAEVISNGLPNAMLYNRAICWTVSMLYGAYLTTVDHSLEYWQDDEQGRGSRL